MAVLISSADTSLFLGYSLSSLSFKKDSEFNLLSNFKPGDSDNICASESSDSASSSESCRPHKELCCVFLIVDSISAREGIVVLQIDSNSVISIVTFSTPFIVTSSSKQDLYLVLMSFNCCFKSWFSFRNFTTKESWFKIFKF